MAWQLGLHQYCCHTVYLCAIPKRQGDCFEASNITLQVIWMSHSAEHCCWNFFFLLWNATSSLPQCVLPTFPFWRSQNSSKKQGLLLCFLCLSHFPNDFRTFHLMSLREITSSNKYFQSSDLCSVVKDSFCYQSILKWKTA